ASGAVRTYHPRMMVERDLIDVVDTIRERDPRYRRESYLFVMAALDHVVRQLSRPRHVSGQELLQGIVALAKDQFGPLAHTVLDEWGLDTSLDVGNVVFHLVEAGGLGRPPTERLQDFPGGIAIPHEPQPHTPHWGPASGAT